MVCGLFVESASAQTTPFAPGEFARVVDPSLATGVIFGKAFKADFNNDGVPDKVVCSNADHSVKVFDGKKLSNVLYSWDGPATNTIITDSAKPKEMSNRSYTGCVTAEFTPGQPSIIISDSFVHPVYGFRIPAEQFVLINLGLTSSGTVKMMPRIVRTPDNLVYRAPVRSVKCTAYPAQLVAAGHTPGQLCFYAGYDQGLPNGQYGDRVALLKLEVSGNTVVAKDLTGSSGLPWTGGVSGTLMGSFRVTSQGKMDGLSMMGGAWLDYDKDGLPDLITVGQHTSIWAFKMGINSGKPEGVSFTKNTIMLVGNDTMTEFLTVSALNEQDAKIQLPCVYITGEVNNINNVSASHDVPDHMRCYENGTWVTHMLPGGKYYSSTYAGVSVKIDSVGRILALAPNFYYTTVNSSGKTVQAGPDNGAQTPMTPPTNLFEINPSDTCQVKLDSQMLNTANTAVTNSVSQTVSVAKGTSPRIGGWVDCNSTTHNAYFTGVTYTSGSSNITQMGWWTEADFLAHQTAFDAIQWKGSNFIVAKPGATKTVGLWNGCSKTNAKIIATVLSCTNNAGALALANESADSNQVLGAETVSPNTIETVLAKIQTVLAQIAAFIGK
jgi:hypothetical protein